MAETTMNHAFSVAENTEPMAVSDLPHGGADVGRETPQSSSLLHSSAGAEIWQGNCLDAAHVDAALGARTVDALIFDAPYSSKTHDGHRAGKMTADTAAAWARRNADVAGSKRAAEQRYNARKSAAGESGRRDIDYSAFDAEKIAAFCAVWLLRCSGWVVSVTDDALAPSWSAEFERAGLYVFAPLPLVETGSRVRMTGDGPSNWTCWLVVARPKSREFASWGTLPGAYVQAAERDINSQGGSDRIVGGKPLRSMCGIVRDYSRRGALVCDPFLGGGTTGLAAKQLGRRFIGMEQSPERAALSVKRISKAREQRDLFETAEVDDAR